MKKIQQKAETRIELLLFGFLILLVGLVSLAGDFIAAIKQADHIHLAGVILVLAAVFVIPYYFFFFRYR